MANLIKAITTGVGGISTTADASGAITFQKDSTTTATIDASGNFAAAGNISTPTGTVTASSFVGNGSGLTGLASAQVQTQLFTSPGTWSKPASATQVKVTVVGGGGGGGSVGIGGVGGFAIAMVPVSAPVTITVGAGGAASPATTGGTGGTSSFGPAVSATGGVGGTSAANGANGTGTTSVGTELRRNVAGTVGYDWSIGLSSSGLYFGNARDSGPGRNAAIAYSSSLAQNAGAGGFGAATAADRAGGVGGAILVEFVG